MIRPITILLILTLHLSAHATTRAPNFNAAKDAAKKESKDFLVFVHGSDWYQPGEELKTKVWDTNDFAESLDDIILTSIDHQENPSDAHKTLVEVHNKNFKYRINNYPAIVFFDHDARPYGDIQGLRRDDSIKQILKQIAAVRMRRIQRDKHWQQASTSEGQRKAELLGFGLDAMDVGLGYKGIYKNILKEIKQADPEDKSGFARKYEFNPGRIIGHAQKLAGEKKYDEALAYVDEQLKCPRLTNYQRQRGMAAKFATYRKWKDHEKDATRSLLEIVAIDPDSDMGQGSQRLHDSLYGPVSIEFGWAPRHCTQDWSEWELTDTDKHFNEPGDYEIKLQYARGRMALVIRSVALYADDKKIDEDPHEATTGRNSKNNIYRLTIPKLKQNTKLKLKIETKTGSSTDSSGRIEIKQTQTNLSHTSRPKLQ